MKPADINAVQMAELVRLSTQIADRAVVADIETEGVHINGSTGWYDVRPMVDEREHSPIVVDMNKLAIDYALMRGLAVRHADHAHLVRITRHP